MAIYGQNGQIWPNMAKYGESGDISEIPVCLRVATRRHTWEGPWEGSQITPSGVLLDVDLGPQISHFGPFGAPRGPKSGQNDHFRHLIEMTRSGPSQGVYDQQDAASC